ncbi:MAG TPA: CRISPR-associated ring nuclease [Ktedonobacteraceae bacterium]|nr:CRISPR-associated ring nuclease [Ktedonobacteraceae bacterium]
MPELNYIQTLVATLGGQPQVVTFTLDLLLRHGVTIGEVIVILPRAAQPRLRHALDCLHAEFPDDHYQIDGRIINCPFRPKILELDHIPLDDITDNTSAKGTRDTIYSFFEELKQQPRHIHLSVTGGRRLMALLAISAAQLKFDSFDHIWHIYTPEAIKAQVRDGAQMHVPPDARVNLIEMPFFPIADYVPLLAQSFPSAQAAQQAGKARMDAQEHARCEAFIQKITHRQFDVLRGIADGLTAQEIADRLCLSIKTVYSHRDKLLDTCAQVWDSADYGPFDQRFLYRHFSRYFETDHG